MLKLAVHDQLDAAVAWQDIKHWIPFAYLVTVLAFARVDLYADRTRRPGLARIATALFQATVIALVFALADGQHFSSYYIFYGSLFFATIYIAALRELHLRVTGWLLEQAGYARRAVLVGSGKHIEAVAHALADRSRTRVDIVGYISLTPRPRNGLRSLGALPDLPSVLELEGVQEVIIADPDFPQDKAVELVDLCHQRGVTVQVAPSTMEILIDRAEFVPGHTVPLFTLRPPVFEGVDYAVKRTFDLVVSVRRADRALAGAAGDRDRDQAELAGPGDLPLGPARDGRQAVLAASSSARCASTPSRSRTSSSRSTSYRARCSRSATIRA